MPFFDKVPGANIEPSTLDARRKLESIKLGPDENVVFFEREEPIYKCPC